MGGGVRGKEGHLYDPRTKVAAFVRPNARGPRNRQWQLHRIIGENGFIFVGIEEMVLNCSEAWACNLFRDDHESIIYRYPLGLLVSTQTFSNQQRAAVLQAKAS